MVETAPLRANVEMELSVLGAIILSNDVLDLLTDLAPEHFSEGLHRQLYAVILKMRGESRPITPMSLHDYIPLQEIAPDLTFPQYVARLAVRGCSPVEAVIHAGTIRLLAIMRGMIDVGRGLERSPTAFESPKEAVETGFAELDALRVGYLARSRARNSDAGDLARDTAEYLYAKMRGEKIDEGAITGIAEFDRQFGSFVGGDVVLMAGRPGMGKTTVALSLASAIARANEDQGVGFFSLEMSERQIGARLVADAAFDFFPPEKVVTATDIMRAGRNFPMDQAEQIEEAVRATESLAVWFDYDSPITVGTLAAKMRMMAAKIKKKFGRRMSVVFIDYLNFILASNRYAGNKNNEVGEITAAIKALAKELGVCIVLLSQLSRKVEERAEKRPQLADLRDSGNLEQDADAVLFLFREAYYLQADPNVLIDPVLEAKLNACRFKLEIILAKNRLGPTGAVEVFCHPGASAIRALAT